MKEKLLKFWKNWKEEIIAIPILIIGVGLYKDWMSIKYPNDFQLNVPSQIDFIITGIVKFIVATIITWISIKIVFPNVFNYLKEDFYKFNGSLTKKEKAHYSIIIFFGFLFALILLF